MNMFRLRDPYRFSLVTGRGATPKIDFLLEKATPKTIGKDSHDFTCFSETLPRTPCAHRYVKRFWWAKGRMAVWQKKRCVGLHLSLAVCFC